MSPVLLSKRRTFAIKLIAEIPDKPRDLSANDIDSPLVNTDIVIPVRNR